MRRHYPNQQYRRQLRCSVRSYNSAVREQTTHPSADRIDCSSLSTCKLCTAKAAHCKFCGIACIRASTSCPALPNVAFGESDKCSEPVTTACPVSQPCSSCRQWPMCQHCEGSGCIEQALPCPGGIAVPSGGTCPIRIAHGGAAGNVTLTANMTRVVVIVLGADSFRVDVAPASLSLVTGGVNGAHLVVDARALDTGTVGEQADVVAPLFASVNATLSNVTALRVVTPNCLTVSNATLGVAGPLVVVLFRATKVSACSGTSAQAPPSTAATSSTLTLAPDSTTSTLLASDATTFASTTTNDKSSNYTLAPAPTTAVTSSNSTLAQATSTVEAATPSDEQGAWIVPVAVSAAAALLVGAGVATFLWKRKRAGQSSGEMVTARAEGTSVRAMSDYGVLPGVRPMQEPHMSSENSHYVELTPIEAGTIVSAGPP
jgi:hypothetical protein